MKNMLKLDVISNRIYQFLKSINNHDNSLFIKLVLIPYTSTPSIWTQFHDFMLCAFLTPQLIFLTCSFKGSNLLNQISGLVFLSLSDSFSF